MNEPPSGRKLPPGEVRFTLAIEKPGAYALFGGSNLGKIGVTLTGPDGVVAPAAARGFHHSHTHSDVNSVAITISGDLDGKRLDAWLGELLQTKGPDIYRMKGELVAEHFEREILESMSGVRLPLAADIAKAKQALQLRAQAMQMAQQAMQAGQQPPVHPLDVVVGLLA